MDPGTANRHIAEKGVTSVQFLLASGLALLLFLAFANLLAVQYGRGAVRSALEQGVRAGSISRSAEDCEVAAANVTGQLLGGHMSDDLVILCTISGGEIVARADVVFEGWTPLSGDFGMTLASRASLEAGP